MSKLSKRWISDSLQNNWNLSELRPAFVQNFFLCATVVINTLLLGAVDAAEDSDPDKKLRKVFDSVKSAVMRIAVEELGHSGTGAIVTSEGHIVLHQAAHLH